jgi:dihydrofolate synthase/folylpolyglutamate synthase
VITPLPDDVVRALVELPAHGQGIGLHRMQWIAERLPAPLSSARTRTIHVTGSKGKGSVSAMVAAILGDLGETVGLYTSPHLVALAERIRTGTAAIDDDRLRAAARWFLAQRHAYVSETPGDFFGAFEAFTAVALFHFAASDVRTLVLEAGIGGRFDATRVVGGRLAALTSVELEHTDLLGPTEELIAYDKADLVPPGGTLVAGELDEVLWPRLEAYCRLRDVTLKRAQEIVAVPQVTCTATGTTLDLLVDGLHVPDVRLALLGPFQARNACVAVATARLWQRVHRPELSATAFAEAVQRALGRLRWSGRFERIGVDPDVYIDIGHTRASALAVRETVRTCLAGRRVLLVTGVSTGKNRDGVLEGLVQVASEVICTSAAHRGRPAGEIAESVRRLAPSLPVRVCETVPEAAQAALDRARREDLTVLTAGSLFLAIELREWLAGRDPTALRFF